MYFIKMCFLNSKAPLSKVASDGAISLPHRIQQRQIYKKSHIFLQEEIDAAQSTIQMNILKMCISLVLE
jgi:hypothetical protein